MARKRGWLELEVTLAAMWLNPRRDAGMVRPLLDLYLDLYALKDDMVSEYQGLEAITARLGQTAVPPLLEIFHSGSPDERWAALDMLHMVGEPGDREIMEAVQSALDASDEHLRQVAASTLAVLASDAEIAQLAKLLAPTFPHNHQVVIKLGQLGGPAAIEALAGLLVQEDRTGITPYTLDALEHIGTPEAIQVIRGWRGSDAWQTYIDQQAAMRLFSQSPAQLPADSVAEVFGSGDGHVETAQEALWKDVTIAMFKRALRDPAYSAWMAAVLAQSGIPEALALVKDWRDENQKG